MSQVRTIFGSMEIGRRADMEEGKKMLEIFEKEGFIEIDTAYMYAGGKTEVFLGNLKDGISKDFEYATKANPWDGKGLGAKSVRSQLETSLKNMKRDKADIFYLHAPDHNTPLLETLETVNTLYKEGKFKEFGLSNYSSWLVAEVVNVCKQNGWIKPTVYQGMYSALTRMVEKELFPCLRYHNIRFYGYSPLGGGFLTGKHKIDDLSKDEPGRFFGSGKWVTAYRNRYWKQEYFDAVEAIRESLKTAYGESVTVPEAAIRWLYHHSALKGGDGVIIGSSTAKHLEENLSYAKKGSLDDNVVAVINNIWKTTSHLCPEYSR
uniref:aflatoxin B1 aldehyde reductase member 2-like n=1 Tax=Styela clava TaxID=7725 RepID=UPI00193AC7A0|nr:aflatoxin B1 aldehyde reductase member 2-like [Styela clava]